ncbi:FAD-dependent monooxygenase [Nonomuraea ceibae]|uniref:FAD-dependent monooxygenase n=1 Tax=Nonomuraea ceibae TaxID=1935170 RepID=UPI001C5E8190|nr:FAD-dependent monooxygenase [Nonomuraea ceibae]
MTRRVLVSGASIAGPAVAYWLDRYGFDVTVVERAPAVRGGGYAIDIRGTALGVVERMGLLPRLRDAHVDSQKVSFVDPGGEVIAAIPAQDVVGGTEGVDLEVRRGDLADALVDVIRDRVEFLFGDSVAVLHDDGDRVEVAFDSGRTRTYDLVIGADGLHSSTRAHVFGPEKPFHRYLGCCFAGFTLPGDLGLAHEAFIWNVPGKAAVLNAHEPGTPVHGFLVFVRDEPPFYVLRDPAALRDLVAAEFAGAGWEVPRLVAAMREADDLFFDLVSQIHLPAWSRGRVALVGDAAYAPSFMSGQGSSIALVGAYVLAGELAVRDGHAAAFDAYEKTAREFVETNQALVMGGGSALLPRTREELDARNAALRDPELLPGKQVSAASLSLALPDYGLAE